MGILLLIILLSIVFFVRRIFCKHQNGLLPYCLLLGLSAVSYFRVFSIAREGTPVGQYGIGFAISILFPLSIILFFCERNRGYNVKQYFFVFFVFCLFCFISLVNPNNIFRSAVSIPFLYFLQFFFFIISIRSRYNNKQILDSLFEAIACWTILEFILTLCYPVMGIESVSSLFYGEKGGEWSMRRENYASAVGTFIHPGNLAFVTSCYALLLYSLFLSGYKKLESLLYLTMSFLIVFFTFSRTSYVAFFCSFLVIFVLYRTSPHKLKKRIVIYILTGGLILYLFSFIPVINDLFLQSDAEDMVSGRMWHYLMGWDMFTQFPFLGTGINNHVNYMYRNVDMKWLTGAFNDFYIESPMHNAHLIVLVETGLLGFTALFVFVIKFVAKLYKNMYSNSSVLGGSLCVISILVFNFIYGFFGWSIYNPAVLTPFLLLICILWDNKEITIFVPSPQNA